MFSRPRSSRSVEQEKTVAQAFVKFLEDNGRKEDMPVLRLKNIYQGEFRRLNPSVDWGIFILQSFKRSHVSLKWMPARGLGNSIAYQKHLESVKHRQQNILITIRKSLNK